jgi:beta-galactosidase
MTSAIFPRFRFFALLTSLSFVPIIGCPAGVAEAEAAPDRQRVSFDAGWRFQLFEEPALAAPTPLLSWRWRGEPMDNGAPLEVARLDDISGADWKEAHTGEDVFNGRVGFAWYRADLPEVDGPMRVIRFNGVDDNATVYLNGQKLAEHSGWNQAFDVRLDSAWKTDGPNRLAVLVENQNGPGGITAAATLGRLVIKETSSDPTSPGFDDSKWRVVHVPHDYVVENAFSPLADANHGSLPVSRAWYRRTFTLPAADAARSVWLDFDGVYRDSAVYLNGHLLGEHKSGYTPFRFDLNSTANFGGTNELVVLVDPRQFEGWWYEGGGIYRHVWLNTANRLHVAPSGTFVTADLPEPVPGQAPSAAVVQIQTKLANDNGDSADASVESKLVDSAGEVLGVVKSQLMLPAHEQQELTQSATVPQPQLWSLETPRLYTLETTVRANGQVVDHTTTPFGIRTIRYDADKGFFLNGQAIKIQGTCNHQDFAGIGIAVPDAMESWRVQKLKEMGANAWRMSHNPPTPELLDACDRLGMLVMDENRHLGDTFTDHTGHGTSYTNLSELTGMLLRDRNHPSIIMWSMCNEEGLEGSPEGAKIFAAMKQVVRQYDPTRPVSCAMNGGWFEDGFTGVEDLMGVNYSPDIYDRFHKEHPAMPMFASETASTLTTRGEYTNDAAHVYVTSYNLTEGAWKPVADRAFVAGSFVWTGFDYKGEPSPYAWPCINSHFGIMDMCGFPKDNYYYYQAWWKTYPIVHILPHWNWPGREGQDIKVIVFGNTEHVELFQDGRSLGVKDMPRNEHLEWEVKYQPGRLDARGFNGTNNSVALASECLETTGAPAALRLHADHTVMAANGEDMIAVEVDVVDARERVVPIADNLINFKLEGPGFIAGVGNGNPGDHDPDKADFRHAFNGKCLIVVGALTRAGTLSLRATADGLKPAGYRLHAIPAAPVSVLH